MRLLSVVLRTTLFSTGFMQDPLCRTGQPKVSCQEPDRELPGWSVSYDHKGRDHAYRHQTTGIFRWTRPKKDEFVSTSDDESRREYYKDLLAFKALPEEEQSARINDDLRRRLELMDKEIRLRNTSQRDMLTPRRLDWTVVGDGINGPLVYVMDEFLTPEECEFMKARTAGRMGPAIIGDSDNFNIDNSIRSNTQMILSAEEESEQPVLRHILKRVHRAAMVPDRDGEGLQIGHYDVGQKYELHYDSSGDRPRTLIMYLDDTEEGGDTIFPVTPEMRKLCHHANRTVAFHNNRSWTGIEKCCAPESPYGLHPDVIKVPPRKGRAVLFINHNWYGSNDVRAEHGSCPVRRGTKWISQRWFRPEHWGASQLHGPDERFDGLPRGDAAADDALETRTGHFERRVLRNDHPRIYFIEDFLSPDEVVHLRNLPGLQQFDSGPNFTRSFLPPEEETADLVLAAVVKRMYRATLTAEGFAEPLQWLTYSPGGSLEVHVDSNPSEETDAFRPMTMIVYLDGDGDPGAGGQTVFPMTSCESLEACCASSFNASSEFVDSILVPPRAGRALILSSHDFRGELEALSSHGACPAGPAGKMVLIRFFRERRYIPLDLNLPKDPAHDGTSSLKS